MAWFAARVLPDHAVTAAAYTEGRMLDPACPVVSSWSPPPESNRRPHPYHRCADGSRRRAAPHVPTQPRRFEGLPTPRLVRRGEAERGVVSGKSLARHAPIRILKA